MADPFIINLFLDDCVTTINTVVTDAIASLSKDNSLELNHCFRNDLAARRPRNKVCFYNDIHDYSDKEFREVFKMSRELVDKLTDYLKEKCTADISRMRIPFKKRLHILLYTLGCTASLNTIARFFGVPKSSISIIFREMCKLVTDCRFDFIKWPNLDQQNIIASKARQFPNCVGFIDSCQFQIKTAINNRDKVNTRKRPEYVISLQAVCDDTLKFTDIYLGNMGMVSNLEVFQSSPLCEQLENIISVENHILGDTKYPLKINLMTPFKRTSMEDRKKYNKCHSATRMLIRRSLGRLKAKFRRLKHLDVKSLDTASFTICTACVLHNFILIHEPDEENDILKFERQDTLNFDSYGNNLNARRKRNCICNYIND